MFEATAQEKPAQETPALRQLVKGEVARANSYYEEGRELVPLIEAESRNALRCLVAIYRRLLDKIERRKYDVWSRRVSLTKAEKLWLAAGFVGRQLLRR